MPGDADRIAAARTELQTAPPAAPGAILATAVLLQIVRQTTVAERLLRDFVRTMGLPTEPLRGLRTMAAQLAFHLNDLGPLESFLRVCYGVDIGLRVGGPAAAAAPGVVTWTLDRGRADFTFAAAFSDHPYLNTILKHWALSLPLLLGYAAAHRGAAGTAALNLEDKGVDPGLAFCDSRSDYFLLPDPIFTGSSGYRDLRQQLDRYALPWAQRRPVAFWRGATTGWLDCAGRPAATWRDLPRVVLCARTQASESAAAYDVGLSSAAQLPPEAAAELAASGLLRDPVPAEYLSRYQQQIDIDGNTNAWMALFLKLYSGSPVLKVQSAGGFRQWYYDRLRPWYNIVPVDPSMDDLDDKRAWLARHPDTAAAIGAAGRALAASLTPASEMEPAFAAISAAFSQDAYLRAFS